MNLANTLKLSSIGFVSILSAFSCGNKKDTITKKQPNIIYILADDLGYGDLSCFGQEKFETPNIDKLAKKGLIFTNHYAGCTVSAPSRACLLTGKHTGHTDIRGNKELKPEGQQPISGKNTSLAKIMKQAGYVTGCFGKWGLGAPGSEGDPLKQGFDQFYGYNCQMLAHTYYPYYLWDNNKKDYLKGNEGDNRNDYSPDLIHKRVLNFIEDNKDKSFFLYYPSVIPHAELAAPEKYMKMFRGKLLPEKNYKGCDAGKGYKLGRYASQPEAHAAFAAFITVLDNYVGNIVRKLEKLNIADNTLIIFTSDNGAHTEGGADPEYFNSNANFRGVKRALYEGGIRVPMIAYWPNKIKPNTTTSHISAFWDVLPTLAEIVGVKAPKDIDGISFYPTLINKPQKKHEFLYWEFHGYTGDKQAIRMGKWKAVRNKIITGKEHIELYNLDIDISETKDVSSKNPDIVDLMKKKFIELRTTPEIKNFRFKYER